MTGRSGLADIHVVEDEVLERKSVGHLVDGVVSQGLCAQPET